jgi:hypothetical protein
MAHRASKPNSVTPNVFIGGPGSDPPGFPLKHAGMTTFGHSKLRGVNPQRFKH